MIDFEDTFEGLTIAGRAKISTKSKSKRLKIKSKLPPPVRRSAAKPAARRTSPLLIRRVIAPSVLSPAEFKKTLAPTPFAITPASIAIKHAQNRGAKTVTPKAILAAHKLIQRRTRKATNLAASAITTLAAKTPILPAQINSQIRLKALEAVAPFAQACKCEAKPIIKKLDTHFQSNGYPSGTSTSLLAGLHDMNHKLEKAAVQRLATYEHKSKSADTHFRCKVLKKLSSIAKCLPECHPARTRAHLAIIKQV